MKSINLIFIALLGSLLVFCLSCSNERDYDEININESPSSYSETHNSKFVGREYGSGGRDIVNELFKVAKKEDDKLERLVKKIGELNEKRMDATKIFNSYDNRNMSYWNSADMHISMIQDSTKVKEMKKLFNKLKSDYNASINPLKQKIEQLNIKANEMNDQVQKMKLVVTAKAMEKYQKNNKPSLNDFDDILKEYDDVIKETEKYATY